MPRKLHINIGKKSNHTVSQYDGKMRETDVIVFHNKSNDGSKLTVTINSEPNDGNALCVAPRPADPEDEVEVPGPIEVSAQQRKKEFIICSAYTGDTFEYKAQLDGAAIEDPIIIIDRAIDHAYMGEMGYEPMGGPAYAQPGSSAAGEAVMLGLLTISTALSLLAYRGVRQVRTMLRNLEARTTGT